MCSATTIDAVCVAEKGLRFNIKKENMREIKFRGLRPHDNKWLYGSLITGLFINHQTKEEICNILDSTEHPDYDCMQDLDDVDTDVITETVGEYTGKKDANGKEIYEGDIIEFDRDEWGGDSNIHVVSWDDKNAEWCWGGGITYDMQYRKVIGNIHENPELLK